MKNDYESIYIVCINDFHAEMDEGEQSLGAAKLVSAMDEFRKRHGHVLVLFGGDNYKGNPITEYLNGNPVSELMRRLDVKASALGNHEFDFGSESFRQWQEDGNFHFLACNLIDKRTNQTAVFVKPYEILRAADKKILVIGICLPERLQTIDRPQEMEQYRILSNQETIRQMRSICESKKEEVDAVIALTHCGLRYREGTRNLQGEELLEICDSLPFLDGAFAAHLHQFLADYAGRTAVAEGGSQGKGLAWLKLVFREGRLVCVIPGFEDFRRQKHEINPDREVQEQWIRCKAQAMEKLGVPLTELREAVRHRDEAFEVNPEGTPLSYMATELMRQMTGCSISLFYSGRIGRGFQKGKLTLYDAEQIFFFENKIVTVRVRGSVIKRNIETGLCTLAGDNRSPIAVSGVNVLADFCKEPGQRTLEIRLENGQPLEMDTEYEVAMDEFLADSQMGFDFTGAKEIIHTGISLKQCMIEKIKNEGITTDFPRRIKKIDESVYIKDKAESFKSSFPDCYQEKGGDGDESTFGKGDEGVR